MLLTSMLSSITNDNLEQLQTDAFKEILSHSQSVKCVIGQCISNSYQGFWTRITTWNDYFAVQNI